MDSGETQYLFKETRLNLEPPAPASVVTIRVPSKAASGRGQRRLAHDLSAEDETTFRLKNLAVTSSVYHRKWHDTPRSFLWRVLDDGTLLSIRAVDICKKDKAPDAPLVLNFNFAVPIQQGCVAFADPEEHDALCVFVLDQASQLYTFTLRPDLFRKRTAIDAGLSELGKVQSPAGLGFKSPHRLIAVTANTLLATVNDGGMIRFDKTKTEDCRLSRHFCMGLAADCMQLRAEYGRNPSSMYRAGPRTSEACCRSRASTQSSMARSTWNTAPRRPSMSHHSASNKACSPLPFASITACVFGTPTTDKFSTRAIS